ncbi:MAG: hypothetical protein ACK2UW_09265 [Anaerolineales bacterium]
MSRLWTRLLSRRDTGGDRTVAVTRLTNRVGRLKVATVEGRGFALAQPVSAGSWGYLWGAAATSPMALTRVRMINTGVVNGAIRLAVMTVPSGSPTSSNALIVYNYVLVGGTMFEWSGFVPLVGRYLYGYAASGTTVEIYTEWRYLTAA